MLPQIPTVCIMVSMWCDYLWTSSIWALSHWLHSVWDGCSMCHKLLSNGSESVSWVRASICRGHWGSSSSSTSLCSASLWNDKFELWPAELGNWYKWGLLWWSTCYSWQYVQWLYGLKAGWSKSIPQHTNSIIPCISWGTEDSLCIKKSPVLSVPEESSDGQGGASESWLYSGGLDSGLEFCSSNCNSACISSDAIEMWKADRYFLEMVFLLLGIVD